MQLSRRQAIQAGRLELHPSLSRQVYSIFLIAFGTLLPLVQPSIFERDALLSPSTLIIELIVSVLVASYALRYSKPSVRHYLSLLFQSAGFIAVGASVTGVTLLASEAAAFLGAVGSSLLLSSCVLAGRDALKLLEYGATYLVDDMLFYLTLLVLGVLAAFASSRVLAALIEASAMLPVYDLTVQYGREGGLSAYDKLVASSLVYASVSLAALALLY